MLPRSSRPAPPDSVRDRCIAQAPFGAAPGRRPPAAILAWALLALLPPAAFAAPDPLSLAKKAAAAASPEAVTAKVRQQEREKQERAEAAHADGGAPEPAQRPADAEHRMQQPSLTAPLQRLVEVVNPEGAEQKRVDQGDEGSPRAAVMRFLDACRAGRFGEAARYLDLPPGTSPEAGARAARRLKAVLDRHHWVDPEQVSARSEGDAEDGLAPGVDELTRIPTGAGSEPIRLVRKPEPPLGRWLFSRRTVEVIDGLFVQLPNHRLLDRLPTPLVAMGPLDLAVWQWLAFPALLVLVLLGAQLFGRATLRILRSIARRTVTPWDDALIANNGGPIKLLWGIAVCDWLLPWLGLYQPAQVVVDRLLNALLAAAFFWAALRSVDVARTLLAGGRYQAEPSAQAFLGFGARFAKLLLILLAVVGVLSELGYPVGSLLAGLGLGGLAFALAAQKTVENLFGALSIGLDQPFRVGDYVRIEGTEGTVETIGLRSTRIRTIDRTLVTIPNGRLAEMRAESFAARDRMRFNATIGLVYSSSEAQLRAVLDGFGKVLRAQAGVFAEDVRVHFVRFGESSLDIEVNAWFQPTEYPEFLRTRQEVLLGFMEVVEKEKTAFAFPTQTVLWQGDAPKPGP